MAIPRLKVNDVPTAAEDAKMKETTSNVDTSSRFQLLNRILGSQEINYMIFMKDIEFLYTSERRVRELRERKMKTEK